MLIGFYSIIFSYKRLDRPGVSHQMRRLFLLKHALYVIFVTGLWLIQLINNYYELYFYNLKITQEDMKLYTESDCYEHYYLEAMNLPNRQNLMKFCY